MADGEIIDEELKAELARPGSDRRFGVNVVAYPPARVLETIWAIQRDVRLTEPRQFFYPAANLHLTVIELASGGDERDADELFRQTRVMVGDAVRELRAPRLSRAGLRPDPKACSLSFTSFEGLEELRDSLTERLTRNGLLVEPRYRAPTAHVTFLRYLEPLRTPWDRWSSAVRATSLPDLIWNVDELWLTGGATWYGFPSRIQKAGPYGLLGRA